MATAIFIGLVIVAAMIDRENKIYTIDLRIAIFLGSVIASGYDIITLVK